MVGTGEIKYPGWTKTSSAARQFGIDLLRARAVMGKLFLGGAKGKRKKTLGGPM
jgi:hypothetical protein